MSASVARKETGAAPGGAGPRSEKRLSLRVVAIYVVLASAWVAVSDRVLSYFVDDPSRLTYLQTAGGWLFVVVTAGALYVLVAGAIAQRTRDLSELQRMRDERRQNQKMEAIGRLAGGIAHDFNNLLFLVRTYASLLARDLDDDDPAASDLREILTATDRGISLTRQLLMFSRKEALNPQRLELSSAIEEMSGMLRRTLGGNVEVVTRLSPEECWIVADETEINQVIVNLTINARDAMPEGGRITIRTESVRVPDDPGGVPEGEYIRLSVSDEGVGIEPDLLDRILEPFFTTKSRGEGTGLGLATVHGIVTRAGGRVVPSSTPGRGTTMDVYWPRAGDP